MAALFGLLITNGLYAQQVILASGSEAAGSGGFSSYSVGQLFYTTNMASNGSVSQGVQQAFEFQTISNKTPIGVNLMAVPYPNPTTDYVVLKIADNALDNLGYTLYDLNGKFIVSKPITTASTQIRMQHLVIGIYLLKVTQKYKTLKIFKIIKK